MTQDTAWNERLDADKASYDIGKIIEVVDGRGMSRERAMQILRLTQTGWNSYMEPGEKVDTSIYARLPELARELGVSLDEFKKANDTS